MLNRQQIAARVAVELQNGETVYIDPSWSDAIKAALPANVRVEDPSAPNAPVDVAVIAVSAVAHDGAFRSGPLAHQAKRIVAVLEPHQAADGTAKVVRALEPATGKAQLVITDLAVFEVAPEGLVMHEVAQGVSGADVQQKSEPGLLAADDLRLIHV